MMYDSTASNYINYFYCIIVWHAQDSVALVPDTIMYKINVEDLVIFMVLNLLTVT